MTPAQQKKVMAASEAASAYNNEGRLKEEAQIIDFFKAQGLTATPPDVDAFRKAVQVAYAGSDMAKAWPKGLLERINAAHWSRSVPQHFKRAADALGVALFGVWAWAIAQALRG